MKRTVLPLLAFFTLCLVGCGGAGSDNDNDPGGDSRFAGSYDVQLTRPVSQLMIEGEITIDTDGDVVGSFGDVVFGNAQIRGVVSASGDFEGTATQDGQDSPIDGDFDLDSNQNLTGVIRQVDNGETVETNLQGTRR